MIIMIIAVINRFLIIVSVTTDISHSLPITDVGASTDCSYQHRIATRSESRITPRIAPTNVGLPPGVIP